LKHSHGNGAARARTNSFCNFRASKSVDIALFLEIESLTVDTARRINSKDELEIQRHLICMK
jgi:hypothetical protein